MTQTEQRKNTEQEKEFRIFHENFDLNVVAHELEQQPDVQRQLLENYNSQYSELPGRMEKHKGNHIVDAQQHGEQVHQTKTREGCVDHLLILAQSAEIVAQSEDGVAGMHTNNQIKGLHNNLVDLMSQEYTGNITADDQEHSPELLDSLSVASHVSRQSCRFRNEVTRPCLTQIRKLARCKYLILDQERPEDKQCKHLQGKTIRLSQIKHQARCKSKRDLSSRKMINEPRNEQPPKIINGPRNEQPQGRILRLSQMKHQARSKGISTAKDGTEEHIGGSIQCHIFKDIKEKVIARRFVEEDICQGDSSLSMVEGVPSHNIFRVASQSSVALLNDKDLLACQHELPKASRCNEKLRANLGAEKLQGHFGSNGSSRLRCESYEHIPSRLPVQNNMQLKEYHRVVARQHRAVRIKEKRALKDKQQNSKNPVQEAQKEFMPVKRLRLTQLRREVRLGNRCSVIQGPVEN